MSGRVVRLWLWLGVVMIFFQIVLGGITRLTGSGLSITQWDIVTGTMPPMNHTDWQKEFALYQETPQYNQINEGMTLPEFKFIFFWEYLHRLWARSIGFVFLLPFIFFVIKGWLGRKLMIDLGVAVLMGAVVATFGWIMVASGLVERPWVNAYNLTVHLNLALILYTWLLWVALGNRQNASVAPGVKGLFTLLTVCVIAQLVLGGLMSGMKAAVYYPTWPDMYGEFFPGALLKSDLWTKYLLFEAYEQGPMPGVIQFLHRMMAYSVLLVSIIIYYKSISYKENKQISRTFLRLLGIVVLQVILGIITVMNSTGKIPLFYGVAHQAVAIILLSQVVYLHWKIRQ